MTSPRPAFRRAILWLAPALIVATVGASPEMHFSLVRSEPVAKQELEAPPEILHVWFSQVPAAGVSRLTLWTGKTEIPLEDTTIDRETKSLSVAPKAPLGPGAYRLNWRGAGDDGHVMTGDIPFTVATPGAR